MVAGSARFADGVFEIHSAGFDFWHEDDYYHFVYQPLTGNGEIIARVTAIGEGDDGYESAGVLFSYDPNFEWVNNGSGKHAPGAKMMWTRAQGVVWGQRIRSEAPNNGWGPGPSLIEAAADLPVWLKLTREQNRFRGYYSNDGKDWQAPSANARGEQADTEIPELPETIWVGVFVCPHTTDRLVTAKLDNVTVKELP